MELRFLIPFDPRCDQGFGGCSCPWQRWEELTHQQVNVGFSLFPPFSPFPAIAAISAPCPIPWSSSVLAAGQVVLQ